MTAFQPISKSISEILSAAVDLITPEGAWIIGDYDLELDDGRRCFCIVGAVAAAAELDPGEAEQLIDQHPKLFGVDSAALEIWNDALGRTQSEVVARLREAAAKAKESGL